MSTSSEAEELEKEVFGDHEPRIPGSFAIVESSAVEQQKFDYIGEVFDKHSDFPLKDEDSLKLSTIHEVMRGGSGGSLMNVLFDSCSISMSTFEVDFVATEMVSCNLVKVHFRGSSFSFVTFSGVKIANTVFDGGDFSCLTVESCFFHNVKFTRNCEIDGDPIGRDCILDTEIEEKVENFDPRDYTHS